ncbi:MAG: peptide deformylase [Candidatus Taylorbacteria bacterium RIFCSPHIGHO2_02_FULL_44_36]|uniref:Peptide deformylase n=1 Tax=Candidatus Taylorbacteria bacterium RIFCSPLOWO2_12_FULL_44_15c TaxID=1802333 RepID=A0A1G2P8U2_9BACT|nr:MAG: peptide deformylase [Candidatus Taylorbacteria bacterium RIFCSPHIGHO2_02_FULL_44_36]OHA39254.1 MAG: peptide deformylase [Candidatus Taylorbacteria bacterium RIFCSPLOWO2_02_FULL_44_35]OHA44129.1 MAG: peptide deformylase [Candidatus Taylorbacteria bacterium RIFCSPLOWO2_12_FULL_44_15c]
MTRIKNICQVDEPILRQIAQPVQLSEIKSPKIRRLIKKMKTALTGETDGVAIAAPQIGVALRIFVVAGKWLGKQKKDLVCINPVLLSVSKKKKESEEGCLSARWFYGKVSRARNASIRAFDEKGKEFVRGAGGLLAQIFQHELDHLEGILFTDKAKDVVEVRPEELMAGPQN